MEHPYIAAGIAIGLGIVCAWLSYRALSETPLERLNRDARRMGIHWTSQSPVQDEANVIAMQAWKRARQ